MTKDTAKDKHSTRLSCIRNDGSLPLTIKLTALEFTWNCPSVQQPDFGVVHIEYIAGARVVETKSLKFYLQQYRYKNAFAEELVTRITLDLAKAIEPKSLSVTLNQNSRGGIANNVTCTWDSEVEQNMKALRDYKPRADFRGGWPEIKD